MVHITINRNNFSAGEINQQYYGRSDLNLYNNGAKNLKNIDILPSGAITRRPGLIQINNYEKQKIQIHKFHSASGKYYLLVLKDNALDIYNDNGTPKSLNIQPNPQWNENHLNGFHFSQSNDMLVICHPELKPQILKLNTENDSFSLNPIQFSTSIQYRNISTQPLHKFQEINNNQNVKLSITGYNATTQTSSINADKNTFNQSWINRRIFIYHNSTVTQVKIIAITSQTKAQYITITHGVNGQAERIETQNTKSIQPTDNWQEASFSENRGWPICSCFHQNRLILAGTKSQPTSLWMSQSGDFLNFAQQDGENDKAIYINLGPHTANNIRRIISGKHLQIFTAGGEWVIQDEVITPSTVTANKQTHIGISEIPNLHPMIVNGSTIFCDQNKGELREYIYTDIENAYLVNNLNSLAPPFQNHPLDIDHDKNQRKIYCVQQNGTIKVLALYNQEKIIAWSHYQSENGNFTGFTNCGEYNYAVVKRYFKQSKKILKPHYFLEQFSQNATADAITSPGKTNNNISTDFYLSPIYAKTKLHFYVNDKYANSINENNNLFITRNFNSKTDKLIISSYTTSIITEKAYENDDNPTKIITVGYPIDINIQALPIHPIEKRTIKKYRLLQAIFYLYNTPVITADTGAGPQTINAPNQYAQVKITGFGWSDIAKQPPWIIQQQSPQPFLLLNVEMRLSFN